MGEQGNEETKSRSLEVPGARQPFGSVEIVIGEAKLRPSKLSKSSGTLGEMRRWVWKPWGRDRDAIGIVESLIGLRS